MSLALLNQTENLHTIVNSKATRLQYLQPGLHNRSTKAFAHLAISAEQKKEKLVLVKDLSSRLTPYEEVRIIGSLHKILTTKSCSL